MHVYIYNSRNLAATVVAVITLAVLSAGCPRSSLSIDDLGHQIRVGMSQDQVLARFGEPLLRREVGGESRWVYILDTGGRVPDKDGFVLGGFQIIFRGSNVVSWNPVYAGPR